EIDHTVRSQLGGHGSIYDLDVELLEKLKPDLIITQELCEVCAVAYKQVEKAARMYVADAQVVSLEPNTIADIFENIKTVGELTGKKNEAESVVRELQKRIDFLKDKTADIEDRPKVFMLEWLEPPFAPGHWTPEQVEIAGGNCILGEAGKKSVTTTYEAIYESKPEKIILVPCGYYTEDILRQLEYTAFPENWREIPAFENGEVWALDASSYFSRPAPRVIDGAEILAKIFHPKSFGAPNSTEAVRVPKDLVRFN
ncbi:MAG: ABC transporter substrate-binding protein, partial [Pyrinomonadaceae bacterium]